MKGVKMQLRFKRPTNNAIPKLAKCELNWLLNNPWTTVL